MAKKKQEMQPCKLIGLTMMWMNNGTDDMPMMLPGPTNEYVIGWFDHPPSTREVSEALNKYMSYMQSQVDERTWEVYAGYEIYPADSLTNLENFQFQIGMSIDFPNKDLTSIELPERVALALPNRV